MGLIEAFKNGALVLLLLASAAGWGRPAARRLAPSADGADRLLFSLGLGLAFLGLAAFAAGSAGLLGLAVIVPLWAAGAVMAWRSRASFAPPPDFLRALALPRAPAVLAAAAAAGAFLFAHSPPVMDDSVYIYLSFPQSWAASGRITVFPDNVHSYFPALVECLYAQVFLAGPAEAAKLLHYAFGILSALAAARLAWAAGARRLALPVAALLTMPWMTSLAGTGKIDLGTLFFSLAAFRAWQLWGESGDRDAPALTGLLAGAAFATKYSGAAAGAALFLLTAPRLRDPGGPRALFLLAAGAALPVLPWLARNAAVVGNPIHPVAFLGWPGDPYLYAFFRTQAPPSWTQYLMKSYDEIVVGDAIWGTGPLVWAFAPLVLSGWRSAQDGPAARLTAYGLLVSVLTSLALPGVTAARFLAPGLGLMAAGAGAWLDRRWDSLAPAARAGILAGLAAPGVLLPLGFAAKRVPLLLGLQTREAFVMKHWTLPEDYDVHRYILNEVPAGEKILFTYLNVAPGFFYPAHRAMGLGAYPPDFYDEPLEPALARLRADGVRWLVSAPGHCVFDAGGACRLPQFGVRLGWLEAARKAGRLRPRLQGSRSALYELR